MDEEDGFRRTPASWTNALLKVAREHLALLVPIVGVLIFALRCVFVSEGDPYVAAMLVSTTSVGDAIRALFFTVVPILLFGLSWVIPIVVSQQIAPRRWREPRILGLLSVSPAALLGYFYFSGGSWIFRGLGQRHMVLYAIISFVLFCFVSASAYVSYIRHNSRTL